ncbi:MAG: hypothetical protein ACK4IY_07925, partial [Chitinophagales bacterium]
CQSVVSTFAGTGEIGYNGDNILAIEAKLNKPVNISTDQNGNIYITENGSSRIRVVNTDGIITTFAGNGSAGYSGDGGLATLAKIRKPIAAMPDAYGNIYIADYLNNRIRKVTIADGIITTVAGTGIYGSNEDSLPALETNLSYAGDVSFDSNGNYYITDHDANCIRKVNINTGISTIVAGNGSFTYNGDGIAATAASLLHPSSTTFDNNQNLII